MPKMKSNRGARKRFKKTASGKIKRRKAPAKRPAARKKVVRKAPARRAAPKAVKRKAARPKATRGCVAASWKFLSSPSSVRRCCS